VRLDQDTAWTHARVTEVGRVDAASHNFLVKLDCPAIQTARSGWFGRARFSVGARHALTAPASALVRRGQLTFVYLAAADSAARLRAVVTGETMGDRVEILAGLTDGDVVIVTPPAGLADGAAIAGARK
jgi:voltage-gated potassium channel Kch